MNRKTSPEDLSGQCGDVMRATEPGESQRRVFVPRETVLRGLSGGPVIDPERFFADIDAVVDQSIDPRA